MRWIWIDKFVEFESGRRAVAVKNVTLAEEHLHDHFPGFPIMPECLMIEAMAQTAGILVGEARDFQEKVVLAKISKAVFFDLRRAGRQPPARGPDRDHHAGSRQHQRPDHPVGPVDCRDRPDVQPHRPEPGRQEIPRRRISCSRALFTSLLRDVALNRARPEPQKVESGG